MRDLNQRSPGQDLLKRVLEHRPAGVPAQTGLPCSILAIVAAVFLERHLIFDVGMHLGEDSDCYLRKGYRVVAFEANAQLIEDLTRKLGRWISRTHPTCVQRSQVPR